MKKILILGDSIRQGYDRYVKMAFEGVAAVYYPEENCRFAAWICRYLHEWPMRLECGNDFDLVHWNAGLWDNLRLPDGMPLTPIDEYGNNIDRICRMIKLYFPKAKMIFATSTPVQEALFGVCKRYNKETEEYNRVAVKIVKRYGGEIDDLYSIAKAAPVEYHSDMTHYYTKEGTKLLTEQVVKCIENSLGITGKILDFDSLFADAENVTGI